jgi:hypothetical protein
MMGFNFLLLGYGRTSHGYGKHKCQYVNLSPMYSYNTNLSWMEEEVSKKQRKTSRETCEGMFCTEGIKYLFTLGQK